MFVVDIMKIKFFYISYYIKYVDFKDLLEKLNYRLYLLVDFEGIVVVILDIVLFKSIFFFVFCLVLFKI